MRMRYPERNRPGGYPSLHRASRLLVSASLCCPHRRSGPRLPRGRGGTFPSARAHIHTHTHAARGVAISVTDIIAAVSESLVAIVAVVARRCRRRRRLLLRLWSSWGQAQQEGSECLSWGEASRREGGGGEKLWPGGRAGSMRRGTRQGRQYDL